MSDETIYWPNQPEATWSNRLKHYVLIKDFFIHGVRIPRGFDWDGASVPRWAWSLSGLTPGRALLGPSCLHDFFYVNKGVVEQNGVLVKRRRAYADSLFKQTMLEAGLSKRQATIAYLAVRSAGWIWWRD